MSGSLDGPTRTPSDFDIWLDGRLESGADPSLMAAYSVYAGCELSRLLGGELLRIRGQVAHGEKPEAWAAQAIGFEAMSAGNDGIDVALDELMGRIADAQDGAHKVFGNLYDRLSNDLRQDRAFDGFRDHLRDRILSWWPLNAGESVLGKTLDIRRLHSVRTAAVEIGGKADLLRAILVERGAFPEDDPRQDALAVFDA